MEALIKMTRQVVGYLIHINKKIIGKILAFSVYCRKQSPLFTIFTG